MEITSNRHGLFEIPLWEFDLSEVLADVHEDLVAEASEAIRVSPVTSRPFRQSTADLDRHSELFQEVGAIFGDLAAGVFSQSYRDVPGVPTPTLSLGAIWVLQVDGLEAWHHEAAQLNIVHNHTGATLSSVLFLDAPEGSDGGTMFFNPLTHVADPRLTPRSVVVPWKPLRFLLFPAWLEHGPARPPTGDERRLTIAADYYANRAHAEEVTEA